MLMKTEQLREYLEPFADPNILPHIRSIRLGTKSLSFWPYRFTADAESSELLDLFTKVIKEGRRQTQIMSHLSHPKELQTDAFRRAVKTIQSVGAVIRSQSPVMRGINDHPDTWAEKWRAEVNLGAWVVGDIQNALTWL